MPIKNFKKCHKIDEFDIFILSSIRCNIEKSKFLVETLKINDSSVNYRLNKLKKLGLLDLVQANEKHYKTKIILTEKGRAYIVEVFKLIQSKIFEELA